MKKVLALILCVFILCGVLCSCGASSGPADYKAETAYAPSAVEAPMEPAYDDAYYEADYGYATEDTTVSTTASVVSALTRPNDDLGAKMIYRANATVETVEFDKAIDNVYSLIADFGGFIESSNVSGADYRTEYYGYQTYRDASFTIRVPKGRGKIEISCPKCKTKFIKTT
ncbi:MAG: DUF4349 domain-containing protein [Oscillospiraceae bacterium]|nr:DUF4349 domain-containing protein [Oscillospiraceae bacterium]